jgi:N-acetylglucosaminyldiphosphoundecaprenol N-acetyl-beta-D-mannosaminyltransferase
MPSYKPCADTFIEPSPKGGLDRNALLANLVGGFSESGIRHRRRARFRRSLSLRVAIRAVSGLRRLTDLVLATLLLILVAPLLLVMLIVAYRSGRGLVKRQRLGRWATTFNQYEIDFGDARLGFLHSLPALCNVIKGEMALIGPRAVSPDAAIIGERTAWKRYDLSPGLLSLWWLRKRANIAYSSEVDLDVEYVETNTLRGDLGIAVRAIPAAFFGGVTNSAPHELRFLGVRIDNLTMVEASRRIIKLAAKQESAQICFVNADCVNIAFANSHYRDTLSKATCVLADGIGVRVAGSILNQNIRENINGTDMLPYLCAAAENSNLSLYLLGGRPGVPEGAAAWIAQRYPALHIAGLRNGYFDAEEEPEVIANIASSRADILLVALGAPRQDNWIAAHRLHLGAKVSIGVGGLLDFYAGRIPRAPVWMRELGMEWLYRFWQEPRRMWRRYFLGNAVFLLRVFRERMQLHRDLSHTDGTSL